MAPRLTSLAFAAAGILFLVYPAIRPSGDDAAAMASTAWVAGHAAAMLGFVLLAWPCSGCTRCSATASPCAPPP